MHNQEIDEMCMYTGLPACLLISHSGPLYLGDLFDASCYLWDLYRTRYPLA